jgi:hemerythrin-like domain-containing protein
MADKNVVDIITQDHRAVAADLDKLASGTLSDAVKDEIVRSLSQHSVAEELLIYPLVGQSAADGTDLEDEARREHQAIKEALLRFDKADLGDEQFLDALEDLTNLVQAHVAEEEQEVLPALAAAVGEPRLRALADEFEEQKAKAPTRPHPLAPDSPGAEKVVGTMTAPVDKLRDKLDGR